MLHLYFLFLGRWRTWNTEHWAHRTTMYSGMLAPHVLPPELHSTQPWAIVEHLRACADKIVKMPRVMFI